jgi:formylglycine-generating enzyme required for sulfatase activity
MGSNPSKFNDNLQNPTESVSWHDAQSFCKKLSAKTGIDYRLPSEAEWEYACRARTTTPFYFGETITGKLVNYNATHIYCSEAKGEYRQKTTPVGQFLPNEFGLYDMHGNVWEWCEDDWHNRYEAIPVTNSRHWNDNYSQNPRQLKLLRGGSWYDNPQDCHSANRNRSEAALGHDYIGFRVVAVARAF